MAEARDPLSLTFAALADPTRRTLLARLSQGEASVTELAQPFLETMTLPAITKHLKVLERAGLITKTREAQWRPCRLNGAPLFQATTWIEQYRAFWEESLDRLGAYLTTVMPQYSPPQVRDHPGHRSIADRVVVSRRATASSAPPSASRSARLGDRGGHQLAGNRTKASKQGARRGKKKY